MIVASLSHSGSKHYEKKESWKILKGYPLSIFVYIHGWLAFYEFYDHEQILMARPDSLTNYITYTGTGGVIQKMSNIVELLDYDVMRSQGLKRVYRKFVNVLVCGRAEKIAHISVVVYGSEYEYGQSGIAVRLQPGTRPNLRHKIGMGTTEKSIEDINKFLSGETSSGKFTMENYSALNNNCNDFSDEFCKFLLNDQQGIPTHYFKRVTDVMSLHN